MCFAIEKYIIGKGIKSMMYKKKPNPPEFACQGYGSTLRVGFASKLELSEIHVLL